MFDTGHIQNIIDQGQKLLAGMADLFKIIPDFIGYGILSACQIRQADNRIQRRPHIVGNAAEKGVFIFCRLPGCVKRVFQKDIALHIPVLFCINLPEAHDYLIGRQGLIADDFNTYPFKRSAEGSLIVSAEFMNPLSCQLADIVHGKALLKFLIRFLIDTVFQNIHQMAIASGLSQERPDILRRFDGFIGFRQAVDPVDGVISIAKNLQGIIGMTGFPVADSGADSDGNHDSHQHESQHAENHQGGIILFIQNGSHRHGNYRIPSVIRDGIIDAPVPAIQSADGGGIIVQSAAGYFLKQLLYVNLAV